MEAGLLPSSLSAVPGLPLPEAGGPREVYSLKRDTQRVSFLGAAAQ